jgi:hypothetical protein
MVEALEKREGRDWFIPKIAIMLSEKNEYTDDVHRSMALCKERKATSLGKPAKKRKTADSRVRVSQRTSSMPAEPSPPPQTSSTPKNSPEGNRKKKTGIQEKPPSGMQDKPALPSQPSVPAPKGKASSKASSQAQEAAVKQGHKPLDTEESTSTIVIPSRELSTEVQILDSPEAETFPVVASEYRPWIRGSLSQRIQEPGGWEDLIDRIVTCRKGDGDAIVFAVLW